MSVAVESNVERKCSGCPCPARTGQRYCLRCHAAAMRAWRKTHPLTEEQRLKDIARSYAGVYLRRGKLQRQPCKIQGCQNKAEMHHPDYLKPLEIEWMCRVHHMMVHREERQRRTRGA